MVSNEPTLWGIHAGKFGEADTLFLKNNRVAIGWPEIGDLNQLKNNREAFKSEVGKTYADAKQGAIPVYAGVLYRFVHEMQIDDLVIYPSKANKRIYVGRIASVYHHNPSKSSEYPHQRSVEWLGDLPRTAFSQGALYEIGSSVSLFQVKKYADEFIALISGETPPTLSTEDDVTVASVAEDIEQGTRDFILKKLSKELKGKPFEDFVARLLQTMGYRTRVAPKGKDGGIDIIAHRDELGFEPPIVKVQVKSVDGTIGSHDVKALFGNIAAQGEYGLFVTLSSFSNDAKSFASGKSNLRLIDGDELVDLILEHYEDFDAHYKGLIPLKRVYVPQSLEESDN